MAYHYGFNYDSLTSTLLNAAQYVDAQGILRLDKDLYFGMYTVFLLLTVGNILMFAFTCYAHMIMEADVKKSPFRTVTNISDSSDNTLTQRVHQLDFVSSMHVGVHGVRTVHR